MEKHPIPDVEGPVFLDELVTGWDRDVRSFVRTFSSADRTIGETVDLAIEAADVVENARRARRKQGQGEVGRCQGKGKRNVFGYFDRCRLMAGHDGEHSFA